MESRPLYLRTQRGQSFGPLDPGQLRTLIAQGKVEGPVLVSEDGVSFAPPGQFLHLRELFPPELWGQAEGPLREGELATTSGVRAYARAAAAEATGVLAFELADRKIEIAFRRGNPDAVESTHPEDALEAFLLARGVDPTKVAQASESKAQFGGDLIAALFGQGLANPATLVPLLSQRALLIALRAMLATSGRFRFSEAAAPQRAMPLGNRWAVLVDLVRRIPTVELRRRLADVRDRAPMRSGGKVSPDELRLTPKELRALSHVDGVRTLEQLVQESPADEEHLLRPVFLLRELDALGFSAAPATKDSPRPPPPPSPQAGARGPMPGAAAGRPSAPRGPPPTLHAAPAPAAPSAPPTLHAATPPVAKPGAPPPTLHAPAAPRAPPTLHAATPPGAKPSAPTPHPAGSPLAPRPVAATTSTRPPVVGPTPSAPRPAAPTPEAKPAPVNFAAEIAELRARLEKSRAMNAFEVLGVTEKSSTAEVKGAYFKLAKQLHPDTVTQGAPAELAKLKESLFAGVGEAYRRIGDDKARAAYIEELKSGGSEVDVSRILQAEDQFNRATVLVKARRFADAAKLLDTAIANNAEEGEYYAWRGYARFFATPDKDEGRAAALRDLNESVKKNPKCVAAYYYLGQIAKLSNDPSTALKHFQKTVELDPHHVDAQRELRILGKK